VPPPLLMEGPPFLSACTPTLQDSRTPALAVALAVTVNIVCNCVAVAHLGLGLQGAAATTVATQVAGAAMLLLVAQHTSDLAPGLCRVDLQSLRLFAATMGPLSVTYVSNRSCCTALPM
jgi:Na+-driven multidrug efflux pump